jgi:predicted alpha-1,6-mannanase (GH76 family)
MDIATYKRYADAGIAALQQWYNPLTGLWESTGWWNAANALGAIVDYSARTNSTAYHNVIGNTFERNKHTTFINNFYDDEGWWALTWINAYDLTGISSYLKMATAIFDDMRTGWDEQFQGGCWWSKERSYKNAIANELFLTVAARLSQRATSDDARQFYLRWLQQAWKWFAQCGLFNEQHLLNDGLDDTGKNNGGETWTYNQGVILGALVEIYHISEDRAFLNMAEAIADATMHTLVDAHGVLREPCEAGDCGGDGPQFKGIFMRNLAHLYETTRNPAYKRFILRNADAIIQHDTTPAYQFGLHWSGPVDGIDAARQSSALDTINAAVALA